MKKWLLFLSLILSFLSTQRADAGTIPQSTVINAGTCHSVSGMSGYRLCLWTDGEFALLNPGNYPVWSTKHNPKLTNYNVPGYNGNTYDWPNGCASCYATFQTDGNLVVYNPGYNGTSGNAYWRSATQGYPNAQLVVSATEPYLKIMNGSTVLWSPTAEGPYSYGVTLPENNAVAWDQVPWLDTAPFNTRDIFVGRKYFSGTEGPFKLIVARMNWETNTLSTINDDLYNFAQNSDIFSGDPNRTIRLTSAMDPTLFHAYGELWVAFECSDVNPANNTSTIGNASCIGPVITKTRLNENSPWTQIPPEDWKIDHARTTVVVEGNAIGTNTYSASVPKIFFWHGFPYLYYSSIKVDGSPDLHTLSTYGIIMRKTGTTGNGVFWEFNSNGPVDARGPQSTEVWRRDLNDPLSNQFADGFGVYTDGPAGAETNIYMTGALGGSSSLSCIKDPAGGGLNDASPGCYRQTIARAFENQPLRIIGFNYERVADKDLRMPSNLSQYVRRFIHANGEQMLWGAYKGPNNANPFNKWKHHSKNEELFLSQMIVVPANLSHLNYQQTFKVFYGEQLALTPGQRIELPNGFLLYQDDGNLVLYNSYSMPLWASGTGQAGRCVNHSCLARYQGDGNFVLYRDGQDYYATATNGSNHLVVGILPYFFHMGFQNSAWQWTWGQCGIGPYQCNF